MRFLFIVTLLLIAPEFAFAKGILEPVNDPCQEEVNADCLKMQRGSFYQAYDLERVIDGDTIVASGKKIRLWGIDTPEKDEPYFWAAKLLLESLLEEGALTCKFIEQDRYQRAVMHCLIDVLDIGSMMVQSGMAKDYSRYSGDYYQYEEDRARLMKRGIWNNELQKNEK